MNVRARATSDATARGCQRRLGTTARRSWDLGSGVLPAEDSCSFQRGKARAAPSTPQILLPKILRYSRHLALAHNTEDRAPSASAIEGVFHRRKRKNNNVPRIRYISIYKDLDHLHQNGCEMPSDYRRSIPVKPILSLSAILPWGARHFSYPAHHILCQPELKDLADALLCWLFQGCNILPKARR